MNRTHLYSKMPTSAASDSWCGRCALLLKERPFVESQAGVEGRCALRVVNLPFKAFVWRFT